MEKLQYKGWSILPTALLTTDGQWSASCDLARSGADGLELFEGVTVPCVRAHQMDALKAACAAAMRQIDDILAEP